MEWALCQALLPCFCIGHCSTTDQPCDCAIVQPKEHATVRCWNYLHLDNFELGCNKSALGHWGMNWRNHSVHWDMEHTWPLLKTQKHKNMIDTRETQWHCCPVEIRFHQVEIKLKSNWNQFEIKSKSMWNQCEIKMKSIWNQVEINLKSNQAGSTRHKRASERTRIRDRNRERDRVRHTQNTPRASMEETRTKPKEKNKIDERATDRDPLPSIPTPQTPISFCWPYEYRYIYIYVYNMLCIFNSIEYTLLFI